MGSRRARMGRIPAADSGRGRSNLEDVPRRLRMRR